MKRKNHWVLFALLLLALINLSPSEETALVRSEERGDEPPASVPQTEVPQETGHIRVAVQMNESDFRQLEQMTRTFMDSHKVQVELTNVASEEAYASFQNLLKLGESPDVLLLDNAWVRQFAADGYLLPTEIYYSGVLSGEVLSVSLVPNEWNGYVWGVPADVDPYVYVFSDKAMKELGMEAPPDSPDAWNALLASGSEPKRLPQHLLGVDGSDPYAALTLLWQLGGGAKENGQASPFTLTGEMQTALMRLEQLRPYLVSKGSPPAEDQGLWNQLQRGELAMLLTTASEAASHPQAGTKAVLPEKKQGRYSGWIAGRSYAVSSHSQNPDAAGEWIEAMTSSESQSQWFEATGHLPVLHAVYDEAAKYKLPDWSGAFAASGAKSAMPAGSGLPAELEEFSGLVENYLNGKASAASLADKFGRSGQ
ncbi:sugar ABC transporter substrate-binding protein [Paenibacillus macerans]|uniref:Bacterial extracellular solute-binding family protein n=1 Tax=Paenibacillus macerans TaxID=44252 RepID=A0A091A1C7_PAEMA|nr:extracellular solute-binding protein [Paenibacillus macerans]KFN10071.1 bacterial extracellular solute-binding family protein [Paenibacillus macerans]MCY7557486.1 extracellular solute-binding protein [Paenibacillus macerans]MEC0153238.1 extracellular solute-binding protein [Paenibacillus macerans]SUA82229.1 family 1 extracellular solute-binding protein [Paenibacillus macerans]GBK64333.1 ABC transporter substrate-binding protein [Paenibacillus macerans]